MRDAKRCGVKGMAFLKVATWREKVIQEQFIMY